MWQSLDFWGKPHIRGQGARQKSWKEPVKGTKILFYGRGLTFFFTLLRGINSKATETFIIFHSNRDVCFEDLLSAPASNKKVHESIVRGAHKSLSCLRWLTSQKKGFFAQLEYTL